MKLTLENINQIPDDVLKHFNLKLKVGDEFSDALFNGNYEFELQTWAPKGVEVLFSSKTKLECIQFRETGLINEKQYNKECFYVPDAEYKKKHGELIGGYQIRGCIYKFHISEIVLNIQHTYKKLSL